MEIEKILKLESPIHLAKLLENKKEILDYSEGDVFYILNYYIDCVNEYLYGCKCDEDINYSKVLNEYENTLRRDDVVYYLTKSFNCNRVDFK